MPWGWRWTLIILAAGLGDLAVRLITDFDMTLVVRAEAVLFLVTGLVLWLLKRRSGARARWARALQWGLVALFVLTGLRAALWAGGLAVTHANIAIAIVGLLWGLLAARRRYRPDAAA